MTKKINTLDLEIAMLDRFDYFVNTVVTNTSGGQNLHECDVLSVTKSGYATEVEIKVSRSDLMRDKHKEHRHESNLIKYFYFCVPEHLQKIALKEIPERCGLIVAGYNEKNQLWTYKVKEAMKNSTAVKWDINRILRLTRIGNIRLRNLKAKIRELKKNV